MHRASLLCTSALALLVPLLANCAARRTSDDVAETADEGLSVHRDDLNGIWIAQVGTETHEALIEAWPAVGVRLDLDGVGYALTSSGSHLSASSPSSLSLTTHPNGTGLADDVIDGTLGAETVRLARDVSPKPPITLSLPGDAPFRSFLVDRLAPAAQRDRESYVVLRSADVDAFLHDCELYKKGYWQFKYMAGADRSQETESLEAIVAAVDGATTTPRLLIHEPKFADAVKANVRSDWLTSYAISDLGLYFSTAAGRSVRMQITDDAMVYFITDRPDRAEKLGLVVTKTPLHGPLASTFGRQLLDLGSMPAGDDGIYARAMMDMLARSDASRASQLSPAGRSAITDWYGVMAIEDYRGVAFGHPELGWGYNLTNNQFYGLVVRALGGQVIVGNELRPGDPSYADVLNSGNDMQEYPDMATLKQLVTGYLIEKHPSAVSDVIAAFAGVVPTNEIDDRAKYDVFHFVCAQLYDARIANLGPQAAQDAVAAVGALVDILDAESAQLETYIVANGITKSNARAPKASGF